MIIIMKLNQYLAMICFGLLGTSIIYGMYKTHEFYRELKEDKEESFRKLKLTLHKKED